MKKPFLVFLVFLFDFCFCFCPQYRCSPQLSSWDFTSDLSQKTNVKLGWNVEEIGEGSCSNVDNFLVCSSSDKKNGLIGLDLKGNQIFSISLISGMNNSNKYAPLVASASAMIAKDDENILLANSSGFVYWRLPFSSKFDPIMVQNTRVILGTNSGGIFAITGSGQSIAQLDFEENMNGTNISLNVISTPSIISNRIYLIASSSKSLNGIYAVDSRTTLFLRFNISWRLLFEEEELQGSPFTYFDDLASQSYVFIAGENYFYGIIDQGFSASILWKQKKPIGFKNLSFVQSNNRNQSWIYSPSESSPLFILVDLMTGHQICQININSLLIGKNNSSSTSWIISSNVYSFGETSFTLLFVAQNQITFANQVEEIKK